jgi:hypothetical protein
MAKRGTEPNADAPKPRANATRQPAAPKTSAGTAPRAAAAPKTPAAAKSAAANPAGVAKPRPAARPRAAGKSPAGATPATNAAAEIIELAAATSAGGDGPTALSTVIESARRLGVEIDEAEASAWIAAMQTESAGGDVVVDVDTGAFGHRATMLDFDERDLERFRKIGRIVGFEDRLPEVRTALALSGSAAQGRIQSYPGDCDYFERVHITAPTREAACAILADVIHDKALETTVGPTYRLWEVKFGSYPFDGERDGAPIKAGGPISWTADEVRAGQIEVARNGRAELLTWMGVASEPGWCKLDWIVADPARGALANASNMLDVTWEGPDGAIVALDGAIDPYFQEVYLEKESLPLFTKLINELSSDSVNEYVNQLEHEVHKYVTKDVNYGKAARRMYNIFRLTGRYTEAAYLRELFDEPTTVLYQVAALIRTIDEADRPGAEFDTEMMTSQADTLIMSAVSALEGQSEAEMVRHLLRVRDNLTKRRGHADRSAEVDEVKDSALAAVNDYFERRLVAVPGIRDYLTGLGARLI